MSEAGGCGGSGFAEQPQQQDAFGCTVTNRFDRLLDDDADPFDILQQAEIERQRRKKRDDVRRGDAGKAGRKESQKDRRTPVTGATGVGPFHADGCLLSCAGQRLGNSGQVENENRRVVQVERGERRAVFRERRLNVMEPSQRSVTDRPGHKLEGGNYMRGVVGMGQQRSPGGFDQRGKRELDRQSSSYKSSVRPAEKREGSGPRNWGSVKDTLSYELEGSPSDGGGCIEEAEEVLETNGESR
ncbi:Intracellular hyaluronan-binding protein 4-like [Arapaima gigas]